MNIFISKAIQVAFIALLSTAILHTGEFSNDIHIRTAQVIKMSVSRKLQEDKPGYTQLATHLFNKYLQPFLYKKTWEVERILSGDLACYCPNGTQIALVSFNNTIQTIDPISGKLQQTLQGAPDHIKQICFSRDGSHIITISHKNNAYFWSITAGKLTKSIPADTLHNEQFYYSPVRITTTPLCNPSMHLWNPVTNKLTYMTQGQQPTRYIYFSPDGKQLASSASDRIIRLWRQKYSLAFDSRCQIDAMMHDIRNENSLLNQQGKQDNEKTDRNNTYIKQLLQAQNQLPKYYTSTCIVS